MTVPAMTVPAMTVLPMTVLVVAKAPVPGLAKTRLARTVGPRAAADLAAAALLDTLDFAREAMAHLGGGRPVVALTGSLDRAARRDELRSALRDCIVIEQRGTTFAERLAAAHADVAGLGAVVQIGMDTPQAGAGRLVRAVHQLSGAEAVLGPATDGGWWLLGLRDPLQAVVLRKVPMSTADTGELTRRALAGAGLAVATTDTLRDVDTAADGQAVAAEAPGTRFAAAHRGLEVTA
jgi:glycosyltransferase A (GT-A) superfamily protein (DUF2064 family)